MIRIDQDLCTDCGICGDICSPKDWEVYAIITMPYSIDEFRRVAPENWPKPVI